jgi:hypothetical protein
VETAGEKTLGGVEVTEHPVPFATKTTIRSPAGTPDGNEHVTGCPPVHVAFCWRVGVAPPPEDPAVVNDHVLDAGADPALFFATTFQK